MNTAELFVVTNTLVTVREKSGTLSLYTSWDKFRQRIDANDLTSVYVRKMRSQADLVERKMSTN